MKEEWTTRIKEVAGDEVIVVSFHTRYTEQELRSIQNAIGVKMVELRNSGIPINSIGVNVMKNEVTAGLEEVKPEYIEAIKQIVGEEAPLSFYESKIELLRACCTNSLRN